MYINAIKYNNAPVPGINSVCKHSLTLGFGLPIVQKLLISNAKCLLWATIGLPIRKSEPSCVRLTNRLAAAPALDEWIIKTRDDVRINGKQLDEPTVFSQSTDPVN